MEDLPEPVAGVEWRPGRARDIEALTAITAAADRVDDPAHVRDRDDVAQVLDQVDPGSAVRIGERAGTPVASSVRFRPGGGPVRLLGAVVPAARGEGIGRVLLAWQVRDAEREERGAPMVTVRAAGTGGPRGLAERSGFRPERTFLTLRRALAGPPPPVGTPARLRIGPLLPDLDEPLRIAKNEAFRDHWQSLVDGPDEWRTRMLGPRLRRDLSRVAVDEHGAIAGFVVVWQRPEQRAEAYVPLVGTLQQHRGRGVARALLTGVLAAAQDDGLSAVGLDVDSASPTGADRLYASLGFERVSEATVWTLPMGPSAR